MWIGTSEGFGYRYEVVAIADGYLVQMRDIDTGALEEREARLFRTARVAFAHAEAMAAIDRFAVTLLDLHEAQAERQEARRCEAAFVMLCAKFNDEGCIYAPAEAPVRDGRVLH
jgi:hypothetical protein